MMSLLEFYDALDRFDWYYDFSDDGRVWRAGEAGHKRLKAIVAEGGDKYEALYNGFVDHYFSGKPWGTEKSPKPERSNYE